MSRRPLASLAVPAALAALALTSARSAEAQSITVPDSGITRTNGFRTDLTNKYWLSQQDCLADDQLVFSGTVTGYLGSGSALQVWVGATGTDCRDSAQRSITTGQCWQVPITAGTADVEGPFTLQVRVRDIAAKNTGASTVTDGGTPTGAGESVAACYGTAVQTGDDAVSLSVYLLWTAAGGALPSNATHYVWTTKFDVHGPPAPTVTSVDGADTFLKVHFSEPSTVTDVSGFRFYCRAASSGVDAGQLDSYVPEASTPVTCDPDAAISDASIDGDADAGDAASNACVDASTDAASDASSSVDSGPIAGGACSGTEVPIDEAHLCGSVTGATATEGLVTGLENDTPYAVAIVGLDALGNIGDVSTAACATPAQVTDFFEAYRGAGGQGGDGFCATRGVGRRGAGLGGAFVVAAVALGAAARRSRRRS